MHLISAIATGCELTLLKETETLKEVVFSSILSRCWGGNWRGRQCDVSCWVRDESLLKIHFPGNMLGKKKTYQWHALAIACVCNNRPDAPRVSYIPFNGLYDKPNVTSATASCANLSPPLFFFFTLLSIPRKCFGWEEGKPSAPRPKFQWAWQLDAKFTVWNIMQWNVANRAAVAFSVLFFLVLFFFFFQSQWRRAVNAALLYFLFYFLPSGQRCTARRGDVGGTRRMDPVGTVNTSPTQKHWAARRLFQRWFFNFAERKWPRKEAEKVFF